MRGSTTANRIPMAISPPEYPVGPLIGQGLERVEGGLPFRDRPLDQGDDKPLDDLVDRLPGRQCPVQIGAGLLGVG